MDDSRGYAFEAPVFLAGDKEMQIDFHDLLVATSVLVGFQVTLFIWRIDREVEKKPEQHSWLLPLIGWEGCRCFASSSADYCCQSSERSIFRQRKKCFWARCASNNWASFWTGGTLRTFYDQSVKPSLVPTSRANRALALCHTDNFVLLARLVLRLWAATVVAFNSAKKSSRYDVSVRLYTDALAIVRKFNAGSPGM